jgi:hypothetical protein
MTLLTSIEIAANYPDNILISGVEADGKHTAYMYLTRNGCIHKTLVSFTGYPYNSSEEAVAKMHEVAKGVCEYHSEKIKGQ